MGRILLLVLVFIISGNVRSQDVTKVQYNEIQTYDFKKDGEQVLYQFDGTESDVVYLLADFTEFVSRLGGTDLDIDLRDAAGLSLGIKEDYPSQFVFAELPSTGVYTAVMTFKGPESLSAKMVIGKSGYLGTEPLELEISDDGFATLFGVPVNKDGEYKISFAHKSGNLSPSLTVNSLRTDLFPEEIVRVYGKRMSEWSAIVELEEGIIYIGLVGGNSRFGLSFLPSGKKASVSITLTSVG